MNIKRLRLLSLMSIAIGVVVAATVLYSQPNLPAGPQITVYRSPG